MRIDRSEAQRILLSPLFVASVGILFLNDFYLKAYYGNLLTGKLSDVSGLFCFPLFFAALFPRRRLSVYISTAVGFTLWKSPFASGLIEFWNLYAPLHVGRVVDYSDLFALAVLPLSYIYANVARPIDLSSLRLRRAMTVASLMFSLFAFTATQLVRDRSVYIVGEYSLGGGLSGLEIEPLLRSNPSIVSIKSEVGLPDSHPDLQTNSREAGDSNRRNQNAGGQGPSLPVEPLYFFDIDIAEQTCNSEKSSFDFIVQRRGDTVQIRAISLKFDCPEYEKTDDAGALNRKYLEHARLMFERHVIDHLTKHQS